MTQSMRTHLQAYLDTASKATSGPWGIDLDDCITAKAAPTGRVVYPGDRWLNWENADDKSFVAASRTEGVWAAQKLLEALDVLEKIAKLPDTPHFQQASPEQQKGMLVCSDMARQFLEGGER